jgi:DNA repair exonuclease SbcCD ATPase subunit
MASKFDQSDFIDSDFQAAQKSPSAGLAAAAPPLFSGSGRPPTREELDSKVGETQQRLAELKRAQEALERERAALEEARRRQVELQTGRQEVLQHLTRGMELLEKAELAARRDAEQMSKTLAGFREALSKVQGIRQETWTMENYQVELTRALTTIENARMEWNSALLKWPILSSPIENTAEASQTGGKSAPIWEGRSWLELCTIGLALTWPLALAALATASVLLVVLFRR